MEVMFGTSEPWALAWSRTSKTARTNPSRAGLVGGRRKSRAENLGHASFACGVRGYAEPVVAMLTVVQGVPIKSSEKWPQFETEDYARPYVAEQLGERATMDHRSRCSGRLKGASH